MRTSDGLGYEPLEFAHRPPRGGQGGRTLSPGAQARIGAPSAPQPEANDSVLPGEIPRSMMVSAAAAAPVTVPCDEGHSRAAGSPWVRRAFVLRVASSLTCTPLHVFPPGRNPPLIRAICSRQLPHSMPACG